MPAQLRKYDMSLWYTTIGTPLSGAACCCQRFIASSQRLRKSSARERYVAAFAPSSSTSRAAITSPTFAMLRGSRCTCGLPPGWMSPIERSITRGTSSFTTNCEASRKPGEPGWMRPLPDCCRSSGSQPISSSEPEQMTRSASRMRAIRLGRASMRCGSDRAVVADTTETLSPPSSCASDAHSGSQAKTLNANAGAAARVQSNAIHPLRRRVFMLVASEPVRAVRAEAHDVLEEHLIVGLALARVVARKLQAHAAELARIPVDHDGVALRGVAREDRKVSRAQRARIDQTNAGRTRVQLVVAITDAP